MPRPAVEFWFEFASTYSYLSVMRIERVAEAAGVEVAWKPFLLGPVFLSLGWNDSPFNIYPPKGRYMWRDLERLAMKEGLPFHRPSRFPRNGLLAARVALVGVEAGWVAPFARAVMTANFAEDREIGEAAEADLRALEIDHGGDVATGRLGGRAHVVVDLEVVFRSAVGAVQTSDVHTCFDKAGDAFQGLGSGTDGIYDLGFTHECLPILVDIDFGSDDPVSNGIAY